MKVRTKLTIGFTVIVVLLWLVTIFAGNNFGSLKSQFAVLDERVMRGTFATHEAEMAANDVFNASMAYVFKDVTDEKETAISGIRHLEQISINYLPPAINTEHARYETAQA